mgnify:CR=1 FL=1
MSVHQNTEQFNAVSRRAILAAFVAGGAVVAAPVQAEQSYMAALYDRWVAVCDEYEACPTEDEAHMEALFAEMIRLEDEAAGYTAQTVRDVHYQIVIAAGGEHLSHYDEVMGKLVAGARAAIGGAA